MISRPKRNRQKILGFKGSNLLTLVSENQGFTPGPLGINDFYDPGFIKRQLRINLAADTEKSTPVYRETWRTHVEVSLIGHASPRWKSAESPKIADRKNMQLSQRRVKNVRQIVERTIRFELKDHNLTFKFNESHKKDENPGTVVIGTDAMGSKETLKETGGDRSAVGKNLQRVDVRVDLTNLIEGEEQKQEVKESLVRTATRDWQLRLGGTLDIHYAVGMSISAIMLKRGHKSNGAWTTGAIVAYGGGGSVFGLVRGLKVLDKLKITKLTKGVDLVSTLGLSYSFGDWVKFKTDTPKRFSDFNYAMVRLTTFGISLGIGGSFTYITIYGFGDGAESMSHSGFDSGKFKAGGFVDHGYIELKLHKGIDDDKRNRKIVTRWEPYKQQLPHTTFHQVEFEIKEDKGSLREQQKLTQVIARACKSYVSAGFST